MIQSIDLKNWMNISEAHLEFPESINIIQGLVGSGKSAVFAAIAYALSDYRRGDSWKDYVKTGEKFFEITLKYIFGSNKEGMVLVIRGDAGKASVSKELLFQGNTYKNSEADQFLESRLDLDIMSKVIFNLQGKQPLALMTPAERRDIFKRIFNSDFNEILEKIKADKEELQKDIPTLKAEIEVLKNKEYPLFRIIAVDESELTTLQEELKNAHLAEHLFEKLDMYTDKLNQLNSTQEKIRKAQLKVEDYLVGRENINRNLNKVQLGYEEEKNKISVLLESIEAMKKNLDDNNKEVEAFIIGFNIDKLHRDLQLYEDTLIELKSEISINKKYLETHKKGKCTECGQECKTENIGKFTILINGHTEEKNKVEALIIGLKEKIQDYEKDVQGYRKISIDYEQKIKTKETEIKYINQALIGYEVRIKEIKEDEIPCNNANREAAEKNIADLHEDSNKIQKWLDTNPKPEIDKNSSKSIKDIQAAIDEIQGRIQSNINKAELNEKLKATKVQDEATIVELNLKLNNLESKVNTLNTVNQIYSIDFPSFINMRACKLLESHMNSFFATTKDHFEVALQADKKGIAFYYKANSEPEWRNLKMVSGFESALSTLGFNVSVARAFGSDIIFLDEPEANADPTTAERLFETIASIGGFKQMFVITHKENVLPILKEQGAKIYKVKGGVFTDMIDY